MITVGISNGKAIYWNHCAMQTTRALVSGLIIAVVRSYNKTDWYGLPHTQHKTGHWTEVVCSYVTDSSV